METREIPASEIEGEDLYPYDDEEAQARIVAWARRVFEASSDSKKGHQERWDKYYKMYRSYVKKRAKGDWRSRTWMPIAFYVIETITPRLVAQLPEFSVLPQGPEDEPNSKNMKTLIDWSADQCDLYLELVKAIKSSLLYGTGVLKTMYSEVERYDIRREPVMEEQTAEMPMLGPNGQPMLDLTGAPMMQQIPLGAQPTGETTVTRTPYLAYQGPAAEAVDIENFFVDPAADSIANARYIIHRVYRDKAHLEDWFKKGIYKKPPDESWEAFLSEHASLRRQDMIGLDASLGTENRDSSLIPILECWTPKTVAVIAGDLTYHSGVLLRLERNPYGHGELPFVRIVDHLVPWEFWGIGELEPLEGLQDTINTIWNSRIDNVKLVLNTMFLAVMDYMVDPSDLQVRPGGIVRVREGIPLNMSVQPLKFGDVTTSSYDEVEQLERMTEKTSGVSSLTAGTDASPALGRTATGLTLVSEQGNTRFAHKVTMAELTGFESLARQFASILQQYMPEKMILRLMGPLGQINWQEITAEAVAGRFDFKVMSESSTQTESIKRDQSLSLFQMLAADPYVKPLRMRQDVIEAFGRKNVQDYLMTEEELQALYAQEATAAAEEPVPEEGESVA